MAMHKASARASILRPVEELEAVVERYAEAVAR